MKVRVFFAWFDLWMGAYYSKRSSCVYICPLPMLVIQIRWAEPPKCPNCNDTGWVLQELTENRDNWRSACWNRQSCAEARLRNPKERA